MQANSIITEAEWQIMKVIWSNNPCSSTFIIKKLDKGKNWAPTTIKTLLTRLVNKKIIDYKMQGRTRNYFPLLTELDCVYSEMRHVINKIYGGIVNNETEHFEFYGEDNKDYIKKIARKLEENYDRVLEFLDSECENKIPVYTHGTLQRFQSAMGVNNGPKWMRAGNAWDMIHMAPEECFDNIDAAETSVHVFITLIMLRINRGAPYWLMQGVSAYVSNWMPYQRKLDALLKHKNQLSQEYILKISQDYKSFSDGKGYEIANTVIEFIVSKYDNLHVVSLIKNPNNIEGIFGCTSGEFWQSWLDYIDKTYFS